MKTKKITFLTSFVFLFTGIVLIFTGCEQDYYDPSRQQGTGSSLFGDSIDVPATFDWATTRNIDMRVKVEDNFNGAYYYTVQVFDANPLFDDEATLLGMGVAKNNSDFASKVVIPEAVTTVYIQQTSPTGGKTIAPVEVSANINYSFGATVTPTASSLRSASTEDNGIMVEMSTRATTDPYPMPALPENPTEVTQTSGQLDSNIAGDAYLITGNFSGTTNFWRKVDLFVQGTLNVTSGQLNLPPGSRLIVLPGASVTTPEINAWGDNGGDIYIQGALTVNGDLNFKIISKLVVFEGGSATFAKDVNLLSNTVMYNNGTVQVSGLLETSNENATVVNNHIMSLHQLKITQGTGLFENYGSLTVEDDILIANVSGKLINHNTIITNSLSLDNGIFHNNNGDILVQGHTKATSGSAIIINDGSFVTQTMGLQGKAKVENNCHMIVEGLLNTTGASIIVGPGGLLSTSNLFMDNTRIELDREAMMKVTDEAVYKYNKGGDQWNNDGFYGTGANKALLQITKAVAYNNNDGNIIHYQGNLQIECYEHPSKYINDWTGEGVTWAGEGGSTLVIPGTECNDGGYSNVPSTPPSNPVFPIIWNGTSVTYLFEDNWPLLGDYDMNDVVMDVTPTYMTNSENKVTQLRLDVVLRALGATKRLAVGLQLDGIYPSMITNVTRSSKVGVNETVFPTDKTKGLENGQTFAVIPIFDIAFEALGKSSPEITNTIKGGGNSGSSMSVPIIVIFNTPVDIESLSIDKFNLFLVNGGYTSSRDEIHLSGYQPTDKANTSKFGAADDNSNSGRLYTSKNNMIWGLAIPGSSSYPTEWTSIRLAFPQFQDWVLSGGGSNKTWYNNPDPDLVY